VAISLEKASASAVVSVVARGSKQAARIGMIYGRSKSGTPKTAATVGGAGQYFDSGSNKLYR
jgi:hypothetical protein